MKQLLIIALLLTGCNQSTNSQRDVVQNKVSKAIEARSPRFICTSYGSFHGGYGDHEREIFIITDSKSGKQYLAVTGTGVAEIFTETTTTTNSEGELEVETTTVEE